jgi:hypothetical protein
MAAALESTAMDEEVGARATTVTASTGGLTAVSSSTTLAPAAIVQQAAAEALEQRCVPRHRSACWHLTVS